MRFITEQEIRAAFRSTPFTEYSLGEGQRLTPEATQFLVDRKIPICQAEKTAVIAEQQNTRQEQLLLQVCQRQEALLLVCISLLLEEDIYLAEELTRLHESLLMVAQAIKQQQPPPIWLIEEVPQQLSTQQVPRITPFYVQLPKGRQIAVLHLLITGFTELQQLSEESDQSQIYVQHIVCQLQQIQNKLQRLILTAIGGEGL